MNRFLQYLTQHGKERILLHVGSESNPKYRRIARSIQDRIASGDLQPGEKLPTFRTLAGEHEVTIETVSRAVAYLADRGLVHTRHGAGSFVTDRENGGGRSGLHTDTILTLVHEEFLTKTEDTTIISNYWLEAVVSAITRASGGLNLKSQLLGFSAAARNSDDALFDRLGDAAGIMLIGDPHTATLEGIAETGVPLCRVNRSVPDWYHPRSFSVHYGRDALRSLANYLMSLGHRRLVFVQDSEDRYQNPTTVLRRSIYAQTLDEWGGNSDADLMFMHVSTNPNDASENAALLRDYYTRGVTAAACYNDASAIAVYRAAQLLGLRIPDDISVVGHDGLTVTDILSPALTTVQMDNLSVCAGALRVLLEVAHGRSAPATPLEFEGNLIIRRSATVPHTVHGIDSGEITTPTIQDA